MNKYNTIFISILISLFCKAQDSIRPYEFGSTLFTLNSLNTKFNFASNRAPYEYLNGIFFRYNKKNYALRALMSYNESHIDFVAPPGTADGISGSVNNKDFRLGCGAQINLKKKKDWLYAFGDICYRNLFSKGLNSGGIAGITYNYSSNANGVNSFIGLGFKIKILKVISICPELTYDIYFGHTKTSYSNNVALSLKNSSSYDFNVNSIFKLHLTAKF